ncbi:hypothetical protein BHM03_00049691 [Ensete ventricosum]|nr:hypothetical protein BHM03_00049691 [Ensete ventricosum]
MWPVWPAHLVAVAVWGVVQGDKEERLMCDGVGEEEGRRMMGHVRPPPQLLVPRRVASCLGAESLEVERSAETMVDNYEGGRGGMLQKHAPPAPSKHGDAYARMKPVPQNLTPFFFCLLSDYIAYIQSEK